MPRGPQAAAGPPWLALDLQKTPCESEFISAAQQPLPRDEVSMTCMEFLTRLSVCFCSH